MTAFLTPMGADDLRAAGVPEPWAYGMADRVRFGEIDLLGHVNNTVYLRWLENLRVGYLRDYGIADFSPDAPRVVVRGVGLEFLAEVKMNASYIMAARTVEMRNTSFTQNYCIFSDGRLTTTGYAVVVLLHQDGTKRPLSQAMRDTFAQRDGAVQV